MEHLPAHLKEDYLREVAKVRPDDPLRDLPVSIIEVLQAHYLISHHFEESHNHAALCGIRDFGLLSSAVARQSVTFEGKSKWTEPLDRCATLFYGLVKNHAFYDGNKRTGLLILLFNVWKIHRMVDISKKELEQLTVNVAAGTLSNYPFYERFVGHDDPDVKAISNYLRKKTHKIDTRAYVLTFRELDQKLRRFGYYLDHINRGFIDLCTKKRVLLREREQVIRQISFPGWKREVPPLTLKDIRKWAGLTPGEKGIDNEVFYNESEPMFKLIQEYESLLKRLKDR